MPSGQKLGWVCLHAPLCLRGINLYVSMVVRDRAAVAWPVPHVTDYRAALTIVLLGLAGR